MVFALVGPPEPFPAPADRVNELESRLRRIGLEVRAAGVLDNLALLPTPGEFPELGQLTTRQREILSRLRRGDRVAIIAAELYVSPSTVRNHLAAIFRKFGCTPRRSSLSCSAGNQSTLRGGSGPSRRARRDFRTPSTGSSAPSISGSRFVSDDCLRVDPVSRLP
jgi:DNA-binding CsgD family transcriptional regulator